MRTLKYPPALDPVDLSVLLDLDILFRHSLKEQASEAKEKDLILKKLGQDSTSDTSAIGSFMALGVNYMRLSSYMNDVYKYADSARTENNHLRSEVNDLRASQQHLEHKIQTLEKVIMEMKNVIT